MAVYWAKSVKTPDQLEHCNVCFRDWVAVRTAASPQGRFEPERAVWPVFQHCIQGQTSPVDRADAGHAKRTSETSIEALLIDPGLRNPILLGRTLLASERVASVGHLQSLSTRLMGSERAPYELLFCRKSDFGCPER